MEDGIIFDGTTGGITSSQAVLDVAVGAFATYSQRFGPYPYEDSDVAETPVSIGGYEFVGMVFIEHAQRVRGSARQLRFLVAHEVAHQWWYAQVGNDPVHEPWLDESLATYPTVVYVEDRVGSQAARDVIGYTRREGALRRRARGAS